MRRPRLRAPALLAGLALGVAPGCRDRAPGETAPSDRILARVNGERIPAGLFEAYLRDNIRLVDESGATPAPKEAGGPVQFTDEVRSRLLDRFLREHALAQRAREHGFETSQEDLDRFSRTVGLGPFAEIHRGARPEERKHLLRYLENCLLIKMHLEQVVLRGATVTEEEVRSHYDGHPEEFRRPPAYRIRLIRLDSPEEARTVKGRLKADLSRYDEIALSLSEEGDQGKDLGMWSADALPGFLSDALSRLEPGHISDPVQDPEGGFNLIYLVAREPAREASYESIREQLKARLDREKKAVRLDGYLAEVQEEARITIEQDGLGFHYVPRGAGRATPAAPAPGQPAQASKGGAT